jgi:hypothetical protein
LLAEGVPHRAQIPVKTTAVWVKAVLYDFDADRVGSAIARVK